MDIVPTGVFFWWIRGLCAKTAQTVNSWPAIRTLQTFWRYGGDGLMKNYQLTKIDEGIFW